MDFFNVYQGKDNVSSSIKASDAKLGSLAHHLRIAAERYNDNAAAMDAEGQKCVELNAIQANGLFRIRDQFHRQRIEAIAMADAIDEALG